ncbi:tail completion or Neck1 protein [Caulobacter phage CcrRogue]|uniref:Uncharacterized protein n=1 Tax=Caulobacter phage CcrRogue TaxID=2927986 RepID=K4JNI8_9CAUD|nr:tail completion or Neck1 protein [Caulobacter phage CcrRogue]AFU86571.1 hypothetical protein CcrRogue_gp089 [Caulobacter phage CcrRogue]
MKVGGAKLNFYTDGNLEAAFKRFFATAEKRYDERADRLLIRLNELILSRTPVWEGDTIHNWRWSTRAPDMRHEDPIGGVDPGRTNDMPLGVEPRRRANEARPRQSLAGALRAKEPIDIYLTNTAESAVDLEYGLLPTKAQSRNSMGMVRISVKEVFG